MIEQIEKNGVQGDTTIMGSNVDWHDREVLRETMIDMINETATIR